MWIWNGEIILCQKCKFFIPAFYYIILTFIRLCYKLVTHKLWWIGVPTQGLFSRGIIGLKHEYLDSTRLVITMSSIIIQLEATRVELEWNIYCCCPHCQISCISYFTCCIYNLCYFDLWNNKSSSLLNLVATYFISLKDSN